ncbi:MAG: hypothetical protein LBF78_08530, partial [Treponema sp.]|nr:hypothetical protein [Treponema sp.]
NVDTLWTDFLKKGILRTVLVQNGSKCKVCPQSNRLCGQTRINRVVWKLQFLNNFHLKTAGSKELVKT